MKKGIILQYFLKKYFIAFMFLMSGIVKSAPVVHLGDPDPILISSETRPDQLQLNVRYRTIGCSYRDAGKHGIITCCDGQYKIEADLYNNFPAQGEERFTRVFDALSEAQQQLYLYIQVPYVFRVRPDLKQPPLSFSNVESDCCYIKEDNEQEICKIVAWSFHSFKDWYIIFSGNFKETDEKSTRLLFPCAIVGSLEEAQKKAYNLLSVQRPGAVCLPSTKIAVPEKKGGWGCSVS